MTVEAEAADDGDDTLKLLCYLAGRSIAHDLLLRALLAGIAMQQPDPQAYLFQKLEELIGSLELMTDTDLAIREQAEQHLRDFGENLATRCRALAAGTR